MENPYKQVLDEACRQTDAALNKVNWWPSDDNWKFYQSCRDREMELMEAYSNFEDLRTGKINTAMTAEQIENKAGLHDVEV